MVSWNWQDRFSKWNNSKEKFEIIPLDGNDDDEDDLYLDMSETGRGHLINTVAILLALVDKGIITTEEFIEYQIQAREAVELDEELGRDDEGGDWE